MLGCSRKGSESNGTFPSTPPGTRAAFVFITPHRKDILVKCRTHIIKLDKPPQEAIFLYIDKQII
jgi:hypothetical protein